ncbi:MAG: hypothetical protein HY999_04460 [Nitrospinae bacterium]|nr:hypothetical protein [Nitrospinota bacterium]
MGSTGFNAILDQAGTYTIRVGEWYNNAIMGYALDLQCAGGQCAWIKPDIAGCINLQGSPLVDSNVILKQSLEPDQTIKTDANGCYKFDNAVSGKKFRVIIKGPAIP